MNAIIGVCHFCEAHGPRPLFCTFTTDDEKHTTDPSNNSVQCTGCTSLGGETVLVSRDDDETIYCSRESVPSPDVTAFLRQAAIRSITCEVSWSKEGGVVYFSDPRGHILSLTFQVRDTRARGLKRWFSIVVLMKDKMLLLNITPALSEHMQRISQELQQLADVVFNSEQQICSQRALRLRTGRNDFGQSRSLAQLTGTEDVYKRLHSHFTWMLKAGALTYTETLYTSQDLLRKLNPQIEQSEFETNTVENKESIAIRELEKLLSKPVFRIILYCALTGINIAIKSGNTHPETVINGLVNLLPSVNTSLPHIRAVCSGEQVLPSAGVCVLEEIEKCNFCCNWRGSLPDRCPTIMIRIEAAMSNSRFDNASLQQHIKCLLLEWLGIAKAVKSAVDSSGAKSAAVTNLKQVFGVTKQDDLLINFWMCAFCK